MPGGGSWMIRGSYSIMIEEPEYVELASGLSARLSASYDTKASRSTVRSYRFASASSQLCIKNGHRFGSSRDPLRVFLEVTDPCT